MPTPDTSQFEHTVGLFKGSSDCKWLYRPQRHCKMDTSTDNWCKVCLEQMILRLYDYVRPIDGPITYEMGPSGTLKFSAKTVKSSYKTVWYVDGLPVQTTPQYSSLDIAFKTGRHTVALAVQDETSNVRKNACHLFDAVALELMTK